MMIRIFVAALIACASCVPAHAQWINQKIGSEFDEDTLHVAVTASHGLGFGLRCKAGSPQVIFITDDTSMTEDTYELANAASPKLRIRIDKGEIIPLDTKLEDSDGGKMIAVSDGNLPLFEQIRDAKKSISVVVTILGKNFHENKFNTRGSAVAVSKLISGCDLDKPKVPSSR